MHQKAWRTNERTKEQMNKWMNRQARSNMPPAFFKVGGINSYLPCQNWWKHLTLVLLNPDIPFANSADPDQLASEKANWSGSALFVIKYVKLYQQSGSSNLIGWQLEMGVAS